MASEARQQSGNGSSSALARRQSDLARMIEERKDAFAMVAGEHFKPERLIKLAHGAIARTPKIAECTPASILVALMRCAELDLEPDGALPQRCMWLIPRWNGKIRATECTYLMHYRAQIQKARDTGMVTSVVARAVRERDTFITWDDAEGRSITKFEYRRGGDNADTAAMFSDRGKVIGYFAAARFAGEEIQLVTMSHGEALEFRDKYAPRDRNGNPAGGPWWGTKDGTDDQFDEMALKTCLRKLWKHLPAGRTEAARRFQEQLDREAAIEEGRQTVSSTRPVDLDLGIPDEETTEGEVEQVIAGAQESRPPPPPPPASLQSHEAAGPTPVPAAKQQEPARTAAAAPPPAAKPTHTPPPRQAAAGGFDFDS